MKYVDGVPVIEMPREGRAPTAYEAFESRCYLNGITEESKVKAMWKVEEAKLKAAEEKHKASAEAARKDRKNRGRPNRRHV